jgi:hypothetical protein
VSERALHPGRRLNDGCSIQKVPKFLHPTQSKPRALDGVVQFFLGPARLGTKLLGLREHVRQALLGLSELSLEKCALIRRQRWRATLRHSAKVCGRAIVVSIFVCSPCPVPVLVPHITSASQAHAALRVWLIVPPGFAGRWGC